MADEHLSCVKHLSSNMHYVEGKVMSSPPKKFPWPTSHNCVCVTLHGKEDFEKVIHVY